MCVCVYIKFFYYTYVWEVIRKTTIECSSTMPNVGNSCFVIFVETLSKRICKFIKYICLLSECFGQVCAISNDEVWHFKFKIVDNEFY